MKKVILGISFLMVLAIGVAIGGFLFSQTLPRPFVDVPPCQKHCFDSSELAGLLASVGIQKAGSVLPKVIMETDKTLVFDIQYPYPPDKIHYAVVPKKDIKDVSQLTAEDAAYIDDAYLVIGKIVRDGKYERYRVITNGAGYQEVAYLHFHLVIDRN